jgi:hypothetical protein
MHVYQCKNSPIGIIGSVNQNNFQIELEKILCTWDNKEQRPNISRQAVLVAVSNSLLLEQQDKILNGCESIQLFDAKMLDEIDNVFWGVVDHNVPLLGI